MSRIGAGHQADGLIAEVEVTGETPSGIRIDEVGVLGLHVMEDGRTVRLW